MQLPPCPRIEYNTALSIYLLNENYCNTFLFSGDNLGAVECSDVELANIPQELMDSRPANQILAMIRRFNGSRSSSSSLRRNREIWIFHRSKNNCNTNIFFGNECVFAYIAKKSSKREEIRRKKSEFNFSLTKILFKKKEI